MVAGEQAANDQRRAGNRLRDPHALDPGFCQFCLDSCGCRVDEAAIPLRLDPRLKDFVRNLNPLRQVDLGKPRLEFVVAVGFPRKLGQLVLAMAQFIHNVHREDCCAQVILATHGVTLRGS